MPAPLFVQSRRELVSAVLAQSLPDRVSYVCAKDLIAPFIIMTAIVLIDRFGDVVKNINSALGIHPGLL